MHTVSLRGQDQFMIEAGEDPAPGSKVAGTGRLW